MTQPPSTVQNYSLSTLSGALSHWTKLSVEYEAFRELLSELSTTATRTEILEAGASLNSTQLDKAELASLLGDKVGVNRGRDAVLNAVAKRIDYVDENIQKLKKQVDILEGDDYEEEKGAGESLMDIQEELDEDGNVTKAWVNGKDPEAHDRAIHKNELKSVAAKILQEVGKTSKEKAGGSGGDHDPESLDKRIVTKTVPEKPTPSDPSHETVSSTNGKSNDDEKQTSDSDSEEGGGFVKVLPDPIEPDPSTWPKTIPNETPSEAQLRREMLEYNMTEIGAVVAELNLEDDGDFYCFEEYSNTHDGFDDEDEDEDEDKYGRSTRQVVTDSYRQEMEELQRRILEREGKLPKQKPTKNGKKSVTFAEALDIAPLPAPVPPVHTVLKPVNQPQDQAGIAPHDDDALPFIAELLERQEIANDKPTFPPSCAPEQPKEKPKESMLLFRQAKIDAHTLPSPPIDSPTTEETRAITPLPLSETVLERVPDFTQTPLIQPPTTAKVSRLKTAKLGALEKQEAKNTVPVSSFVIERNLPSVIPQPPDEYDPKVHRKEVAMQFHKLRNRIIQRESGFVLSEEGEEAAIVPLDDSGENHRVSRFKAAILKRINMESNSRVE